MIFHFRSHCWEYSIRIVEEHLIPLTKFEQCGCQLPLRRLNTRYYVSENCKKGEERRLQRETPQNCFESIRVSFQINAEVLSPPEAFPYLGQMISYNSRNYLEVYQNLRKTRRRWEVI